MFESGEKIQFRKAGKVRYSAGVPFGTKLILVVNMPSKPSHGRKKPTQVKLEKLNKSEELLLKQIGLLIHKTLFNRHKPVEWLSFKSGVARSSIREIIAGRSNFRILTLNSIAKSLGFSDATELLNKIKNKNGNGNGNGNH